MGKDEFVKLLIDNGYDAYSDKGVVMVSTDLDSVGDVHNELIKLAHRHEYCGSIGVRLAKRNTTTSTE